MIVGSPPSVDPVVRRPARRPIVGLWMIVTALVTAMVTAAVTVVVTSVVLSTDEPAPEWRVVFHEDFSSPTGIGTFPGSVYGERFSVYPDGWADTSGRGVYRPSEVLSVEDGMLTWDMRVVDGQVWGAAVLPTLPTYGQTYGRYSLRFRADPAPGFGMAFLLWPDSERWPRDGEIDFPEGEFSGQISAYAHHASENGAVDSFSTGAGFRVWHVAEIEWRPESVRFLIDGRVVGTSTEAVPARSMHWVLQTGSTGETVPADGTHARVQVDWMEAAVRQ